MGNNEGEVSGNNKETVVAHALKLSCHPYALAVVFFLVMMLTAYLVSQNQYNRNLQKITDTNIEAVVSFVAGTIEELNREVWEQEDSKIFILPPVRGKDQVESVKLINALGGIIYPHDQAFDILEEDALEDVLKIGGTDKYSHDSLTHGTYYRPVFNKKELMGAIVLKYKRKPQASDKLSAMGSRGLLILSILGVAGAVILVWLILMPWRILVSRFEHSIETGEDVDFSCEHYKEIVRLKKLFRLLLLR